MGELCSMIREADPHSVITVMCYEVVAGELEKKRGRRCVSGRSLGRSVSGVV